MKLQTDLVLQFFFVFLFRWYRITGVAKFPLIYYVFILWIDVELIFIFF